MHYDIESMSEQKVREELNKYVRLFDVAYDAVLTITSPSFNGDAVAVAKYYDAIIRNYPNDDRFRCGGTAARLTLEVEQKNSPAAAS